MRLFANFIATLCDRALSTTQIGMPIEVVACTTILNSIIRGVDGNERLHVLESLSEVAASESSGVKRL